jgi:hypothetical protein
VTNEELLAMTDEELWADVCAQMAELERLRVERQALCFMQPPLLFVACDRLAGHVGPHSWEDRIAAS